MPPAVNVRRRGPVRAALDKQIAAEVAALPNASMRALLPVLQAAKKELQRDIRTWLDKYTDGNERYTAFRHRQALLQLNAAMRKIRELEPAMFATLNAGGRAAGALATKHVVKQVDYYSKKFQGASYALPLDQAAAIASGRSYMIPRFATSAARYAGKVGSDIREQLAIGLVKGETIDELTKRLIMLGGPKGMVALQGIKGQRGAIVERITEGLFRRYPYWAERVVRTEVLAAYNHVSDASLRQYGLQDDELRRRWNAAGDRRTCVICRDLDGQVVDIGEPFPGGYESAPAHPNCRCNVGPWKDHWTAENEKAQAEGEKPPEKPPEPALSPDEIVRKVELDELSRLNHERLVAFDSAGKRLFSADGMHNEVALTNEQIAMLEGNRVTHNHPPRPSRFNSLSITDVTSFAASRLSEMAAITLEPEDGLVRYSVRMKPGAKHPDPRRLEDRAYVTHASKLREKLKASPQTQTHLEMDLEAIHETWERIAKVFDIEYRREVIGFRE